MQYTPKLSARLAGATVVTLIALALLPPPSFAAAPSPSPAPKVVLNEVMYHLPGERDAFQYVEIHNPSAAAVDLTRWSLRVGIKFQFPDGYQLPAGGYAVICRDQAAFQGRYGAQISLAGVFKKNLSHAGERIELADAQGNTVDAVEYLDHAPWPMGADGYGGSLERICPAGSGTDPANWQASDYKARQLEGTPGAQNSCYAPQPPPRVSAIQYDPPQPNKPIAVRATVTGGQEIQAVTLAWSIFAGPGTGTWTELPMERVSGDAKAGNYAATIPAQPPDRLIRFRVSATNAAGLAAQSPAKGEPRAAYSLSTFVNTNTAKVPFLHIYTVKQIRGLPQAGQFRNRRATQGNVTVDARPTWTGAAIYLPPGSREVQVFDYVRVRARRGGFKIKFHDDQRLEDMSCVAIIDKGPMRWMLAEYMSQTLFKRLGAAASEVQFDRVWLNRRPMGCQLQLEAVNKSFLRRHERDDHGDLYKLQWAGNGLVGQHKKMTNVRTGHKDLQALVQGLRTTSGAEQWEFIQRNFNVDQMVNCYVGGMCVQDWDGFFNNYFVYHDTRPNGKWEIYPWDKDKTWGDYDGASPQCDWYSMPLTYGMNTSRSSGGDSFMGFGGFDSWKRPPGWFSGPLLANPEFRQKFFARLREATQTVFTPEKFTPVIQGLALRLKPEANWRATMGLGEGSWSEEELLNQLETFENQVIHRREYILKHLPAENR